METQLMNYRGCRGRNENKWNGSNDHKYDHRHKKTVPVEENLSAHISAHNVRRQIKLTLNKIGLYRIRYAIKKQIKTQIFK